jgi:hypothetical protein
VLDELIAGVHVLRQQDPDADVPVVLVHNRGQKDARKVCMVKAKEEVQDIDRERVED